MFILVETGINRRTGEPWFNMVRKGASGRTSAGTFITRDKTQAKRWTTRTGAQDFADRYRRMGQWIVFEVVNDAGWAILDDPAEVYAATR